MDVYEEKQDYINNFWMKSNVLYTHFDEKLTELKSLGEIFKKLANLSGEFSQSILKAKSIADKLGTKNEKNQKKKKVEQENFYIPLSKPDNSTRSEGIKALFDYFDRLSKSFNFLDNTFRRISNDILDKQSGYETNLLFQETCDKKQNVYQNALMDLYMKKKSYYDSINKAIEYHLSHLNKPGKTNDKFKEEIKNKRNEYLAQVKLTESFRVEYVELQGHAFSIIEEFERNCTNDLKIFLKSMDKNINIFQKDLGFNESEMNKIEEMDGMKDIHIFTKNNKSLMTGPKRNIFKEYKQDINYYMEKFNFLKKEIKNKSSKELNEFQINISKEVDKYLNEIIIKEKDEISDKIKCIAKNLNENKLENSELNYLIDKFEVRFKRYLKWKEVNNVDAQEYKKVGEEYEKDLAI